MPGAEDENVPLAELDPLGLLDRLEFGAGHGLTRLQPPDAAEPWHVQQHAPADEPVAVGRHVERGGALRGHHLLGGPAVIDAALVGDVAERVHVGVAVAVEGQADVIRGERDPAGADVDVMALDHVMDDRARVVRPGRGVHRDRHRHAPPGPDRRGRAPHGVRRDVIHRPELVVGSPAAPVLDRLEGLVELGQRDRRGRGRLHQVDCVTTARVAVGHVLPPPLVAGPGLAGTSRSSCSDDGHSLSLSIEHVPRCRKNHRRIPGGPRQRDRPRSSSSSRMAASSLVTRTSRNPPCSAPRIASALCSPPATPTTLGMHLRSASSMPIRRS